MLVRNIRKALYIKDISTWIGDCFTKEALGVWTETSLDLLVCLVWIHESTLYAKLLHCHSEEIESAAIDSV